LFAHYNIQPSTTFLPTMASQQAITIIGSTGNQGLSVLKSLLSTSHPIRALTRSPSKLQSYNSPNLTILETDITNTDQLRESLKGVWAVFVNTISDYSEPEGTEEALLKSIIDVAAASGVEWLLFSSLPEGMPARAYIEKSNAAKYAKEVAKTTNLKPIFVQMGWYMTGFSGYMRPTLNTLDGFVEFRWSVVDENTKFPLVSALTDLGPVVKAILENPIEYIGAEIPIVGEVLTIPQVAETYAKVTGQPARAVFVDHIPQEDIPSFTERHLGYREVGYFPSFVGREEEIPKMARKLYPGVLTFEDWMRETGFDIRD